MVAVFDVNYENSMQKYTMLNTMLIMNNILNSKIISLYFDCVAAWLLQSN